MARDGSSGGCVRLMNITKDKTEREFVEYNLLPNKMWEWYELDNFLKQLITVYFLISLNFNTKMKSNLWKSLHDLFFGTRI